MEESERQQERVSGAFAMQTFIALALDTLAESLGKKAAPDNAMAFAAKVTRDGAEYVRRLPLCTEPQTIQ